MKRIMLYLLIVLALVTKAYSCETNLDSKNNMFHQYGKNVEFSYLNQQIKVNVQTKNDNNFASKLIIDNSPNNLLGYLLQIEGPENANAQLTITIAKRLLKNNAIPHDILILRNHLNNLNVISGEQVKISEKANTYIIKISAVNQFSIWGLFGDNPPIPTLTDWTVSIFIGLLSIFGGWFLWKRMM